MTALREFRITSLKEGFQPPASAERLIRDSLMGFKTRQDVVGVRGGDFVPVPAEEEVFGMYDAVFTARAAGHINGDEFSALLGELYDQSPEGGAKVLAGLLREVGAIVELRNNYKDDEANELFLNTFCPAHKIDPLEAASVFVSDVQHPSLQASVINMMRLANKKHFRDVTDGMNSLVLGLRYHLLSDTAQYKWRGVNSALAAMAMKEMYTGDPKEATGMFLGIYDLAVSANDPTACEPLENAAISICIEDPKRALVLAENAFTLAQGLGEEKLAISTCNFLGIKGIEMENRETTDEEWGMLALQTTRTIEVSTRYGDGAVLVELYLIGFNAYSHLGNGEMAEKRREEAVRYQGSYNSEYSSSAVKFIAEKVFLTD